MSQQSATTTADLEASARRLLDGAVADFVAGGAEDEQTLRANERAWRRARFRPCVLRDVSSVDVATRLLGQPLDLPLLVAPTGSHLLVHPEGERATAQGAAASGVGYVASSASSLSLEEIAAVAGPARWFQLYWFRERAVTLDLVHRAVDAGYRGVVLTVDAPVLGLRRRDVANRFDPTGLVRWANLDPYGAAHLPADAEGGAVARYFVEQIDRSTTFDDVAALADEVPVVVKGIVRGDDAREAVAAGAAAIYVSNHGGRQLDRTLPTREALADVVAAVDGRVPVIVDGGLRDGADVAVALTLGASAAALGRPVLWAAAVAGAAGVTDLFGALGSDLVRTMALLGAPSLADLGEDLVATEGVPWE